MNWNFGTEAITFRFEQYTDSGGTAVEAWCEGDPYATISVNMPGAPVLPEGQFYLKDWSENTDIAQAMIAEGIIEAVNPPMTAHSGFITATAYQFKPEFFGLDKEGNDLNGNEEKDSGS